MKNNYTQEKKSLNDNEDTSAKKILRILLVDDHEVVRNEIAGFLNKHNRLSVVAEAEDGLEAVKKAAGFLPDVIIMDVNMPELNGIEATHRINKKFPQIKIIGLSVQNGHVNTAAMKTAGAFTLLNKAGDPEELIKTILSCMNPLPKTQT
ncbi:MAG: response regulator transcription factor [Deltaproteobacteria bacterium]|nr:response regulator transcription factor [Deltaproteobacteria bacterium]